MGESREREGIFGPYTEHRDDQGNKVGESRERGGIFGPYTEHRDDQGNKVGESREREGIFGPYTEHRDDRGDKAGESREREGIFGPYTEHVDRDGNKLGESRQREGLFGPYTEHSGGGLLGAGSRSERAAVEDVGDDSGGGGEWIIKIVVGLFALVLVIASWALWGGMLVLTAVLAAVLGFSLAGGGWAVQVDERLGGRIRMLPPAISILAGVILVYGVGWGGAGFWNKALLTLVLIGGGVACWYASAWIFDFARRRSARSA